MVFLDYDQAGLDRQYDQRAWAPNAIEVIRRYTEASDKVRTRLGEPQVFAYGDTAAETLDLYRTQQPHAPLHIYIHGGAWRLLGKRDSAYAAETFVRAGAHFIALDFALITAVPLSEMVAQVRRAIVWIYRNAGSLGADSAKIYISGHSSGAHLAANVVATDWPGMYGLPRDIVKGAVCASGIYDLLPVRISSRNDYVRIDARTEHDLSPQRHIDRVACPVIVAYGELESDEFRRQSREFAAALGRSGFGVTTIECPGRNHFEVGETMVDPDDPLTRATLEQMGLKPA